MGASRLVCFCIFEVEFGGMKKWKKNRIENWSGGVGGELKLSLDGWQLFGRLLDSSATRIPPGQDNWEWEMGGRNLEVGEMAEVEVDKIGVLVRVSSDAEVESSSALGSVQKVHTSM